LVMIVKGLAPESSRHTANLSSVLVDCCDHITYINEAAYSVKTAG